MAGSSPIEPDNGGVPPAIDTEKPHPARVYDYFLGGKDNFAADREVAAQALRSWPTVRTAVRENRAFIGRAVRYLAAEGIDQFLDIGSGLPSGQNVHEVAQSVTPGAHVVYADNDPIVLAHARALLTSAPDGKCAYIHADLREPSKILESPAVLSTLDFSRPIGLILAAVLHFVPDEDKPAETVRTLVDALPSGSFVVASHTTAEHAQEMLAGAGRAYQQGGVRGALRDAQEFGD